MSTETLAVADVLDASALSVQCSFPDCGTEARWIARGHRPCSTPVVACDGHKAQTEADLGRVIPGWTCSKCRSFSPTTLADALNWRFLG